MGAYNPPAPAVTPVSQSIYGVDIEGDVYVGVKMSDGSTRLVSIDGSFPYGSSQVVSGQYKIRITASPGIYEEQPANVPISFTDYETSAPAGYETIEGHFVYTSYVYDQEESLANWMADMEVEGTKQWVGVANGDTNINLPVQ